MPDTPAGRFTSTMFAMPFGVPARAAAAVAITVIAAVLLPVPVTAAVPLTVTRHGCCAAATPPPGLSTRTLLGCAAFDAGRRALLLCTLLCLKSPLSAIKLCLFVVQRVKMRDLRLQEVKRWLHMFLDMQTGRSTACRWRMDCSGVLRTQESRQAASYAARVPLHLSGTGRSSANSSPKLSMHAKKASLACACAQVAASPSTNVQT